MKAIRVSEISFGHNESVDLLKDKKLAIIINLFSLAAFVFFYCLFFYVARLLSLTEANDIFYFFKIFREQHTEYELALIVIFVIILVIHELIHGLFFYLFTGDKPVFGYKLLYAYAGAPGWYIKKIYFLIISLSPLIIITFAGFISLYIVPKDFTSIIFLTFTANAAGCIGDIWITFKLINKPEETYVNDSGTSAVISYN